MLNHFKSAIDKFFSNSGQLLKPVVFNLTTESDYDLELDKKTKLTEKITIKSLCLEKNQSNEKKIGMSEKSLEVICRASDFRKRIPSVFDFFVLENKTYNITEVTNDNGIYVSIKGE